MIKAFTVSFGIGAAIGWMLSGAALAQDGDSQKTPQRAATKAQETLAYNAQILGIEDKGLKTQLEALSDLMLRRKEPPLSRLALERRAKGDEERLISALQSEGYYSATIHTRIDYGATPPQVTLDISPGPLYKISGFDVLYTEQLAAHEKALPKGGAAAGVALGAPAKAGDILAAQGRLADLVRKAGYPLAELTDRKFIVDPASASMRIEMTFDQKPSEAGKWRFGDAQFEGLATVDAEFLKRKVPWREGDVYDVVAVDKYRQSLEQTGLFEYVRVEPSQTPPVDSDILPVIVTVKERKHRTIGIGANYSTSEGPGAKVYWQNRNFNGKGRRVELTLTAATLRQGLAGSYRRPEFLRDDQSLFATAEVYHEDNDAYKQVGFNMSSGLERRLFSHLTVSGAGEFEVTRTDENDERRVSQLLTFPFIANYDTTDSYLDATRGVRSRFKIAPSSGNNDGPISFLTLEASASTYFGILKNPQTTLALRGRLGMIAGEDTNAIPANRRFYAGGGGSIRGYAYKDVGPRDINGDPTGGRSVAEIGMEARIRVNDTIGVVPFIEGGNAYADFFDSFGKDFQWGAGLGFRYYSPIGPLRLDVAVPLNRRDGLDDAFQIYVSIGQAF